MALRLRIGLNIDAARLRGAAGEIAQFGFVETVHRESLQRNEGQEHVDVDVGDHGFRIDSRILRKVLRAEQALFFGSNEQEKQRALESLGRFFQ